MPSADDRDQSGAGDSGASPQPGDPNSPPSSGELENAQQDTTANSTDQTTPPCNKTHWIEIKLLDQDGNPIPSEAYLLTGPDGNAQNGSLDDQGFVRIEGLGPGTCSVAFPNLTQRYKPDLVDGNNPPSGSDGSSSDGSSQQSDSPDNSSQQSSSPDGQPAPDGSSTGSGPSPSSDASDSSSAPQSTDSDDSN